MIEEIGCENKGERVLFMFYEEKEKVILWIGCIVSSW